MKILSPIIFLLTVVLLLTRCNSDSEGGSFNADHKENTETDSLSGIYDDYEKYGRANWQKPDFVIRQFGDLSGKTIADIGAGTGFFSRRLVYKAEKVLAIDVNPYILPLLDSVRTNELPKEFGDRLEIRLCEYDDPKLKPEEVDAVLLCNTFMYINNRVDYLKKVKSGMKPGGILMIIDFKKQRTPLAIPAVENRLKMEEVVAEMHNAGFLVSKMDRSSLENQYLVIGEKR